MGDKILHLMSSVSVQPGILENAKGRERALLRILPSFTDLAFLFPLVALIFRGSRTLLEDSDTGWHIRTGDWILQNGRVPHVDIFSFTKLGQPWFAWEWLCDVLFSLIHRAWGLSGLVLINALLLSAVSVLLYRLVRRHAGNDARALVITVGAMLASSIHWLARPHLLSWVLILIALHLIDRAEAGQKQLLWWMPGLTAVWANLHGSFPVAILLLLTYGVFNVAQDIAYAGFREFLPALGRNRTYLLCAGASFAASLLNPYGWHLHEHIVTCLTDTKQVNAIAEYASFDFHLPLAVCMEFFLLAAGSAAVHSFAQRRWAQGIILLASAHMAFKYARNLPMFVILAAAPIAALITSALETTERAQIAGALRRLTSELRSFGQGFDVFERVERAPFIPVAATVMFAALLGVTPLGRARIADFDTRQFPVAAARVFENQPTARVFTFDQWGGYLIYRLYPKLRVFVDGRSDFYGADYTQAWVRSLNGCHTWESELLRYSIDTVLVKVDAPLASLLKQRRDWKTVFDDGRAIVFKKQ